MSLRMLYEKVVLNIFDLGAKNIVAQRLKLKVNI